MRRESQPKVKGTGCFGRSPEEAERVREGQLGTERDPDINTRHRHQLQCQRHQEQPGRPSRGSHGPQSSSATRSGSLPPHMHTSCSHLRAQRVRNLTDCALTFLDILTSLMKCISIIRLDLVNCFYSLPAGRDRGRRLD